MILIDVNILVYAHTSSYVQHQVAHAWLDQKLNGSERVGLPWESLIGFLRVVTNPRIFPQPESIDKAWQQVRVWLSSEVAWIPVPTERHTALFEQFLTIPGMQANLVHDAHLAALSVEYGLKLCSTDGDFARFPGLRWTNPLAL